MLGTVVQTGAVIERNERFWQDAFAEHGSAVLAFLVRRAGSRDEAEDLLQETFVRAMRFDSFKGGNLRGYLLSIARNLIINKYRRPRLIVPVETPTEDAQPFESVPGDEVSPEETARFSHLHAQVRQAMGGLPEDHRTAFELAVLEQRSYAEIAEQTGWTLARVKTNVHRARKKLLTTLGPVLREARG